MTVATDAVIVTVCFLYGFMTLLAFLAFCETSFEGRKGDLGIMILLTLGCLIVAPLWPLVLLVRFFCYRNGTCFGFGRGGKRPWKKSQKPAVDEENQGRKNDATQAGRQRAGNSPPPYDAMELPEYPSTARTTST